MIISLEGTRCSGKTHGEIILREFFKNAKFFPNEEQYNVLHTYIPKFETEEQRIYNEEFFLSQTKEKLKLASLEKFSFVNRDFLSVYAFSKAYFDLYKQGNPDRMLEKIVATNSHPPDLRILFQVSPSVVIQRQKARHCDEFLWSNEEFIAHLIDVYEQNKNFLGVKSIIVSENYSAKNLIEVIENAHHR